MHERSGKNGRRKETLPSKRRQPKKPRHPAVTVLLTVLVWILKVTGTLALIGVVTGAIISLLAAHYIQNNIMPYTDLDLGEYTVNLTSVIYYTDPETGQPVELQSLYGEENRVWVGLDEIPEDLVKATIAVEDKRFYEHQGVDWLRTSGAFVNMFLNMSDNFGGSTLTQQLIKNVTDDDDVTVKRKILEIFRALEFERNYSKKQILEFYLNYIYLGRGCYGVYSASYAYFGKHVSELSLAECASLIGITNNPSVFDPYINKDLNKTRQEIILWELYDQEIIDEAQYKKAKAEKLVFQRGSQQEGETNGESSVYSWYVDQVINDVIADLMERKGLAKQVATHLVFSGGYSIFCNLDPRIQAVVDGVYQDVENLPYTSKTGQQLQSGITIIDPYTGKVVALSGGMGEKTTSRVWSRATDTVRPPGSSIKPVSVYAPALDLGLVNPGTVLDDTPHMLLDDKPWPRNVDYVYSGLTTVYRGVQISKNTLAVKVLSQVGPQFSYEFMTKKLGFSSLVASKEENGKVFSDIDLAPLALGGLTHGVSTLEMAAAYASFVNNGMYTAPTTYSKVLDNDENVVLDNTPESTVAMKESTAFYINYMLKGVVSGGTGTGARLSNMTVAGKTGTTTSKNDTWFVGYTPYYVGAVWVGYDIQEAINVSANQAPLLWKKVMEQVHAELENKDFHAPDEVVQTAYCRDSGMLATEACKNDPRGSRVTSGYFLRSDSPTQSCNIHTEISLCTIPLEDGTEQSYLAGPFCPVENLKTISAIRWVRDELGLSVEVGDAAYTVAHYEAAGVCPVHTATWTPPPTEDPDPDPSPWWPWPWDPPWIDPSPSPSLSPSLPPTPTPTPTPTPPPSEPPDEDD